MLAGRQKETYEQVQEYLKKNPGVSQYKACKETGNTTSTYWAALKKVNSGSVQVRQKPGPKPGSVQTKRRKKQEMITMAVPQSKNVVALVIPEGQVASTLKDLLGV